MIENFSPKGMPGFGLDYAALKAMKPDIIMVSVPGLGSTGPDKNYISYAATVQAIGGLGHHLVIPVGNLQHLPYLWLTRRWHIRCAWCLQCSLSIIIKQARDSMLILAQSEAITSLLPEVAMEYVMNGRIRPRMGNRNEIMAPHGAYPCKGEDKWVAIAVANDEEWKALCRVMGNPEWCKDEKFSDQFNRWQNQDELNKLIGGMDKGICPL